MIKLLPKLLILSFLIGFTNIQSANAQLCSDAGTATSSADSVCYSDTTTLTLTGYIGAIQWQGSIDNITFVDEIGPGSTTDSYDVNPQETRYFRAVVTDVGCLSDTGNVVTLTVGTIPVPTGNNATRCGPGQVTLSGSGSGTLQWYADPTGGYPFASGSPVNEYFPATTTVYLEDNTQGGSGGASPLLITEIVLDPDILELQNVSNQPVDVTGWQVAINGSYNDINNVNTIVQVLSGVMQPGDIITFTDNSAGPNYWGNNMLWNPGAFPTFTAWALILDDQGNLKDFVIHNWPMVDIQGMNVSINGTMVSPGTIWNGDGVDQTNATTGNSVQRIGIQDNNINTDHSIAASNTGTTNPGMTLPFLGFGCSSPRIPVEVTITNADAVTITPTLPSLCQGQTTTLTASSNNNNYTYTWSPPTGLNTTTGPVVMANPTVSTTYIVIGDDGTCSNVDTIDIAVGTLSQAGTAFTYQDTICFGNSTDLILQGSNGAVQWQSFDGTNWINEVGIGSDSIIYNITPLANNTYRAILTSGGCPSDTTTTIDIVVLTITDPILSDTSLCGSGNVTLTPVGQGNFNWYDDSTSVTPFFTGQSYSYNATATDTFWVESFGGADYTIGAVNPGIGNQTNGTSNDLGMAFDVIAGCTIESVKVFPQAAGPVTINLRDTQGGPVLASYTTNVIAFLGQDLPIKFTVSPGTNYRLELATGSVACTRNTSGAAYPYQVLNGPLEITGYYTPAFGNFGAYYWFYDWRVSEGCKSARKPVVVTVNAFPATPTISQSGNTLTSSAPAGNQWILNGSIIPGATNQTHNATQVGTYTVAVTVNGCTSLSPPFTVTTIGINEIDGTGFNVFPNPVSNILNIESDQHITFDGTIRILDLQGREVTRSIKVNEGEILSLKVDVTNLSSGHYFLEILSIKGNTRMKFNVNR